SRPGSPAARARRGAEERPGCARPRCLCWDWMRRGSARLRPFTLHRSEGAHQALFEAFGRALRPEPAHDEDAQALLHFRARVAVGAEKDVRGEIALGGFVERAFDEEVNGAFHVMAAHVSFATFNFAAITRIPKTKGGFCKPPFAHSMCGAAHSTTMAFSSWSSSSTSKSPKSSSSSAKRSSSSLPSGSCTSVSSSAGSSFFLRPFVSSLRERILAGSAPPRM